MNRAIVKSLACISGVKLFFDQQWQVALFGEPAQSQDGWIINLPADELFAGDYSSLPAEVLLAGDWVQARAAMKGPLAELVCQVVPSDSWEVRVAQANFDTYQYADLFRDLGLECEETGSLPMAYRFMQKAAELRPEGPYIRQKLKQYLAALA